MINFLVGLGASIGVIIIYSLFSKQIVEGVVSTGSKEG